MYPVSLGQERPVYVCVTHPSPTLIAPLVGWQISEWCCCFCREKESMLQGGDSQAGLAELRVCKAQTGTCFICRGSSSALA